MAETPFAVARGRVYVFGKNTTEQLAPGWGPGIMGAAAAAGKRIESTSAHSVRAQQWTADRWGERAGWLWKAGKAPSLGT